MQDVVAVHVTIGHYSRSPSVSTQITTLRRLLLDSIEGEVGEWFGRVSKVPFYPIMQFTV